MLDTFIGTRLGLRVAQIRIVKSCDSLKNILQVIAAGLASQNYEVAVRCSVVLGATIDGLEDIIEDPEIQSMVLDQAVAAIELHDGISPLVSGHVLGALYQG